LSPSSLRIEALQQDKIRLESELGEAKVALERSRKENGVLRRAVAIQQDRHKQTEAQLARAVRDKADADDKIRALEQMVVALRYHHWQASSSSHPHASSGGTMHDFMGGMPPRPPDVF
jgi:septal ring factor EnvC (AmiA/AmiB activator)